VSQGVFELVVPMPDDGTTTYKTPLPFDLLPLSRRGQKVWPIGTAFAISPTQFVTAAHVLLAAHGSRVLLRDAAGASTPVARVLRLSQYRDLAVFEVAQAPAGVVPLEERTRVALGESVLTAGNAGGQGIVARGGTVTSFTLEEVDGQWRDIRFTAPASPGNSGGPLVDADGRVVGVVVAKSAAENLNYAVPIAELHKLRTDEGDLSGRGLAIREDGREMRADWAFHPRMPISLAELERGRRGSFTESAARWYAEFDAKFGDVTFPNHPRLKTYLNRPGMPLGLGRFQVDGNGTWGVGRSGKVTEVEVTPGQKALIYDGTDRSWGHVILQHPRGTSLAAWFESPKGLADVVVRNYSWSIQFADRAIGIESLGPFAESERWSDEYGRPWFTYVWRLNRTAETVLFDCLTTPHGLACAWHRVPSDQEDAARLAAKRDARRVTLSYAGTIRDWVEFLALPAAYKPRILAGASVRFDDGLSLRLGPMVAEHIQVPALSLESTLTVYVSLDPASVHQQLVYQTDLNPKVVNTYAFGVQEVLAPTPERPALEAALWAKLQAGAAPFDDKPAVEAKTMNAIKRGVPPPGGAGRDRMELEFCRNPVDESKTDLEAACARFQSALRLPGASARVHD
jgi:hypothetical protein